MSNPVRLIYWSEVRETLDEVDLDSILFESVKNNDADGITGLLAFDDTFFLQLLDGPRDFVNRLYARLINDQRHNNLRLLEYRENIDKVFTQWSMAAAKLPEFPQKLVSKRFGGFRPDRFNVAEALEYLEMLRDYLLERNLSYEKLTQLR